MDHLIRPETSCRVAEIKYCGEFSFSKSMYYVLVDRLRYDPLCRGKFLSSSLRQFESKDVAPN